LRLIVETIPGLIAVMTPEGGVEHVNRQVLEYFGRTLEELKQWGTSDAVHPADLPRVLAAWQHAVETGLPHEFEHRIRRADGEYRWFQSRGLPLRNVEGRIVRWYNLLTDIDARKRSEEKLRRSEADLPKQERADRIPAHKTVQEAPDLFGLLDELRLNRGQPVLGVVDPFEHLGNRHSGLKHGETS
jgi:PAS domain S-box-containing protein